MTTFNFFANVCEHDFIKHSTDAPVFAVSYADMGYSPIYTRANAKTLNARHGWTDEEIKAAIAGSMFGWHVPAAQAAVDAVKARL